MRDQQLYPDGRWVAGESTLPVRNPTSLRAQGMGVLDHSALLWQVERLSGRAHQEG